MGGGMLKALITGASSGIGLDMARILSKQGHELILVARDKDKLKAVKDELGEKTKIIVADLSVESKLKELYILCKNEDIDILINNAGFGECGEFTETDLANDIRMIELNIKAVHVLTKLFLRDMKKKNSGYILNVASMAAFSPGPLMATYYSTKAYVLRLTESIYEELRRSKSKVSISCLCPGPTATNFNKVANVKFSIKPHDSMKVAMCGLEGMFNRKLIIIPNFKMKFSGFSTRFLPIKLVAKIAYGFQRRKLYK